MQQTRTWKQKRRLMRAGGSSLKIRFLIRSLIEPCNQTTASELRAPGSRSLAPSLTKENWIAIRPCRLRHPTSTARNRFPASATSVARSIRLRPDSMHFGKRTYSEELVTELRQRELRIKQIGRA